MGRLRYNNKNAVLLPGDIDKIGLENLIEEKRDIDARILIFPHHGGTPGGIKVTEFVEKICELTKAEIIIFSIDSNDKDYPRVDVIKSITSKLSTATMLTTGFSNVIRDFIKANLGCAHKNGVGSIEIDFDNDPLTYKNL